MPSLLLLLLPARGGSAGKGAFFRIFFVIQFYEAHPLSGASGGDFVVVASSKSLMEGQYPYVHKSVVVAFSGWILNKASSQLLTSHHEKGLEVSVPNPSPKRQQHLDDKQSSWKTLYGCFLDRTIGPGVLNIFLVINCYRQKWLIVIKMAAIVASKVKRQRKAATQGRESGSIYNGQVRNRMSSDGDSSIFDHQVKYIIF